MNYFIVGMLNPCGNCVRLEEEVADLQSLLYPPNDAIPEAAWNIFPENGKYLKKILDFGGYSTRKSLESLEKEGEVEKLFEFIRDIAEDIDDEEERKELLGVFHKNPKKLKILPGLADIFQRFIANNKPEKIDGRKSSSSQPVFSKSVPPVNKSAGDIDESVTSSSLTEQLEEWVSYKFEENHLQERLQNCLKEQFKDTFSLDVSKKECICLCCKQTLMMPKKNYSGKIKLSITNITRHLKNCWLDSTFLLKKNKTTGKQMSMKMFVKKTSDSVDVVDQPRPTLVDLTNEPPPVAMNASTLVDFEKTAGCSKRIKLETKIKQITTLRQDTDDKSKNLHQPAGI